MTKYRFVPIDESVRQRLLDAREQLDFDADDSRFSERPYAPSDRSNDLCKYDSPYDPHRGVERQFDATVRELLKLAKSHPETDVNITVEDCMDIHTHI